MGVVDSNAHLNVIGSRQEWLPNLAGTILTKNELYNHQDYIDSQPSVKESLSGADLGNADPDDRGIPLAEILATGSNLLPW